MSKQALYMAIHFLRAYSNEPKIYSRVAEYCRACPPFPLLQRLLTMHGDEQGIRIQAGIATRIPVDILAGKTKGPRADRKRAERKWVIDFIRRQTGLDIQDGRI